MLLMNGYNKINSVLLLTIPLFVLAGSLINNGGLGEKLVNAVEKTKVGKSKTGLGVITVVAVSYTHLDVYKRQFYMFFSLNASIS